MAVIRNIAIVAGLAACTIGLSGCQLAAQVGTAQAEAEQKPPVSNYGSKQASNRVFTAAMKAMGDFGTVRASDRESGLVQGQKGNWIMSATVSPNGAGAKVSVSARYVPSKQMDFNSRDGLTKDFLAKLEKELGENLTRTE